MTFEKISLWGDISLGRCVSKDALKFRIATYMKRPSSPTINKLRIRSDGLTFEVFCEVYELIFKV